MNSRPDKEADNRHSPPASAWLTFLIVASCSILFCSKGVFAKSAYSHGADPITVLVLRMGFALPVFLVVGFFVERRAPSRLAPKEIGALFVLGFFGYYFSSFVNFEGLKRVSVGLERMTLYSYPSLVLFGSALFFRTRVRKGILLAAAISYLGIILGFQSEVADSGNPGVTLTGVSLVFLSALTYACFILISGVVVHSMSSLRFISWVVGFSCVLMIIHFLIVHSPSDLMALEAPVYWHGVFLAVFGTVLPAYLMGTGLRRAGAQRFAIIGTVGPVATLVLAWCVLGETMTGMKLAGFLLALSGGLLVTLLKDEARSVSPEAPQG